jgi:hypothetical protein
MLRITSTITTNTANSTSSGTGTPERLGTTCAVVGGAGGVRWVAAGTGRHPGAGREAQVWLP